jgi:hypothetical protein
MKVTVEAVDIQEKRKFWADSYHWQKAIKPLIKDEFRIHVSIDFITIYNCEGKLLRKMKSPDEIGGWIVCYVFGLQCPELTVDLPLEKWAKEVVL